MASGGPYGIDAGAHKVGLPASERADHPTRARPFGMWSPTASHSERRLCVRFSRRGLITQRGEERPPPQSPCRIGAGAGSFMTIERGAQKFPIWAPPFVRFPRLRLVQGQAPDRAATGGADAGQPAAAELRVVPGGSRGPGGLPLRRPTARVPLRAGAGRCCMIIPHMTRCGLHRIGPGVGMVALMLVPQRHRWSAAGGGGPATRCGGSHGHPTRWAR